VLQTLHRLSTPVGWTSVSSEMAHIMGTVLLFSVDSGTRRETGEYLSRFGYQVRTADGIERVVRLAERFRFDVFLADVRDSRELLKRVREVHADMEAESELVVIVTGALSASRSEIDEYAEFDVITRPYSLERLRMHLARTLHVRRLRYEAQSLRHERDVIYDTEGFVAASKKTRELLALARKVARSDSTVLLTGETGTGKELVAGAVHYGSPRAEGPFVKVNCAALPGQLLEDELFGHEKGAFTGADRPRPGRFEQANTGTIFFDEIGDMNLEVQAKVLRVLQEREFQRLGGTRTTRTDVRIIAATNKHLEDQVRAGEFRDDLYYRLNVIRLEIPPLRRRREDILPLVERFSGKLAADLKRERRSFSPDAIEALLSYTWPGNIRELKNVIERAVLLAEGDMIRVGDLGLPQGASGRESEESREQPAGSMNLKEVERSVIVQALERSGWVQKRAAVLLGVSTRVLNHKIGKLGIRHSGWRKNG